jgi:hypothetical protein
MDPTVLLIANPSSGAGRGRRQAEALGEALAARGIASETLFTLPDECVFAGIAPERHRAIVLIGGDGTVHAAINGLRSLATPIAFAGTGTINVLARELGLPSDPEGVAALVAAGRVLELPLLRASGRRWLLFAESGFLARIVHSVNRRRGRGRRHGRIEFLSAALEVLPRSWGRPLAAEIANGHAFPARERFSDVLLTRARRYGGSLAMPLAPGPEPPLARPSFALVGLRSATPFGHLLVLGIAALGLLPRATPLLERLGLVRVRHTDRARLSGPAGAPTHLDAESLFPEGPLSMPVVVEADAARLRLLVP